jgi:hypothetical protein
MLEKLHGVEPDCRILDPGAGCGGRARVRKAGLGHRIAVRHGVVEDVPEPDAHFDIVGARIAFCIPSSARGHSPRRSGSSSPAAH